MKLYLAPMEGLVDMEMRQILTAVGGFDACVTEFVRITDQLLPSRVYYRMSPELHNNGKTASGTPVIVQILGGLPDIMAANAARAAELGAPAIDINFGCPSKFTNRKAGGAILLKEPQRLYDIISAVRQAVPDNIPVSAKIRLGYEDTCLALDNASAASDAGASFLTVHARTKSDGYKPPARWEWLAQIREHIQIPVIGNGDITSVAEFKRCREISGCEDFMIGRGAIAQPDLALQIKLMSANQAMTWSQVTPLILDMIAMMSSIPGIKEHQILGRIKQWLNFLRRNYSEAETLYQHSKREKLLSEFLKALKQNAAT
jgi:tRNA-dihydrouridine synthase C